MTGISHAPPASHGRGALAETPPFDITPAPPLMSLFTAPPHPGQAFTSGSDIFCRRSKWSPQSRHSYSYAGMGNHLVAPSHYTNPRFRSSAPFPAHAIVLE
jgi:hypothetical protein